MKIKTFKLILVMLAMTVLMGSCKKNDDPVIRGTITYDGDEYSLTKGYVENQGSPLIPLKVTVNQFAIFLTSPALQMQDYYPAGTGDIRKIAN